MSPKSVAPDPSADCSGSASAAFSCASRHCGLATICVDVAGALDYATAPQLDQILVEVERDALIVVLDLCELTSIDEAGKDVIAASAIRAAQLGRQLILVRAGMHVDEKISAAPAEPAVESRDIHPAAPVDAPVKLVQRVGT